ncbi:hypothetical protein BJY04DRAFT_112092 [Aspergillus karnatakaensis]|uniref:uncharacterized protein n=1 Tax=Aspergillus karnatakaensis TaxID=1810916 RepID=UPI003CCD4BE9
MDVVIKQKPAGATVQQPPLLRIFWRFLQFASRHIARCAAALFPGCSPLQMIDSGPCDSHWDLGNKQQGMGELASRKLHQSTFVKIHFQRCNRLDGSASLQVISGRSLVYPGVDYAVFLSFCSTRENKALGPPQAKRVIPTAGIAVFAKLS